MTQPDYAGEDRLLATATLVALVLVFAVIVASAYLRLEQSGLGCAGWPACYGSQLAAPADAARQPVQEQSLVVVLVRFTHRMAAAGIGLLIMIIAILCIRARRDWPAGLAIAVALVVLLLFLALLGRLTQGTRLPAVTLGNLIGGMTMLALLWWLRLQCRGSGRVTSSRRDVRLAIWSWICLCALVLQIGLGALVSAVHAAASCVNLTDCHGILGSEHWTYDAFNPWREVFAPVDGAWQADHARQALQMGHRIGGLATAACLSLLARLLFLRGGACTALGLIFLVLLLLQILLGVAAVVFQPVLLLVLLHNVTAALLVLAVVSAIHHSRPAEAAEVSSACQMMTSK